MEKLKGKTILIGKEPGQGRLMVAVSGTGKSASLGAVGSVPGCVSRCKPAEGVGHAAVVIDASGNMILKNVKSQNITYVNGQEIVSKRISVSDSIELGKDRFGINLSTVLETAKKLVVSVSVPSGGGGGSVTKTFNIAHLEVVWTDYHNGLRSLRENQKRVNLIRSGCGIFTMCAMPCIFFFGPVGYVLTAIGVIGNIYSFIGLKNDNTGDEQERLTEKFQERYVCPNPDCNKFLGNQSYKLLKRQYSMHCPYCKCEFVEKR
ncbi:MAG: FHA domain-containing protein [Bacteroidaceae bacterium]|nr:FHA domain-containing protein [Bacteroidaceae bacterium]